MARPKLRAVSSETVLSARVLATIGCADMRAAADGGGARGAREYAPWPAPCGGAACVFFFGAAHGPHAVCTSFSLDCNALKSSCGSPCFVT